MHIADATVNDCSLSAHAAAGLWAVTQGLSSALAQGTFLDHTTGTGESAHSYSTSTFQNGSTHVRVRGKRKGTCSREAGDGVRLRPKIVDMEPQLLIRNLDV